MHRALMQGMVGTVAPLLLLLLQTVPSAKSLEELSSAVQCVKEGAVPDDESDSCATYYQCAVNADNVLSPVFAQCPDSTVFSRELRRCVDASAYVCERARERREAGFQCTETGRYPNVASTDCKSYYLCTENTDGSLIAALVNCPSSTIFSEEKRSCVQSPPNICPYAPITTTSGPQSSTTVSDPSGPFVCPSEGRFVNEQSSDCSSYYLCITINNQLVPQLTICGSSLIFSPIDKKCVSVDGYSCPKLTATPPALTTAEVATDIPLTPPGGGGTTTTAATTSTEVTSDIPLTTPSTTTGSGVEITTPTAATTTTTTVASTESPTSTTLTTPTDSTTSEPETSTPTASSEASTTSSIAITDETTVELPTTTQSNPATTTAETTTDTSTTINTEVSSTTEASTTEITTSGVDQTDDSTTVSFPITTSSGSEAVTTTLRPIVTTPSDVFECPAEGRYPDPNGSSCESYILCIRNSLGTLTPLQFFCPPTTIFSVTVGLCVPASAHRCGPETSTTITTTTTTAPTTTTTTPVITTPTPFVCPDTGRYPNPASIYCKSYYLCLYDGNLNLIAVELSCPSGSIFATDVYRCVPAGDYQCVLGSATTTAATTTTTAATTTSTTTTTTAVPATTTTSKPTTIGMAGACTGAGKFPSDQTNDCSSYQFCVQLASGELVEFIFKCPGSTLFDEQKKVCSDRVVCTRGI